MIKRQIENNNRNIANTIKNQSKQLLRMIKKQKKNLFIKSLNDLLIEQLKEL